MLIGRREEQVLLKNVLKDDAPHFIAVYGRRRIGKTFLIRETFKEQFTFQHAGVYKGTYDEQLFSFNASLKEAGYKCNNKLNNWLEAFEALKEVIRSSNQMKKIIFIDELSWMDTPKSDMVKALESFWNGWASARNDIVLIICASATSWMISKVIHNKGGLYNRLTERIHLKAFTLKECEELTQNKGLLLTRAQILESYMVFGGVPYYWNQLEKGKSIAQNIDKLIFSEDALLKEEYQYLLGSLFKNPEAYKTIIEVLGKKKIGLTREEIIQNGKLNNSGNLTKKLEELELCGFIRSYNTLETIKKGTLYQLVDNYTLFYYQIISKNKGDEQFYSHQINTPLMNTWKGLAFERVCLNHIKEIKKVLGVSGVLTQEYALVLKQNDNKGLLGSQIDLAIVRADYVINLCEIKYANTEYVIDKEGYNSLQNKIHDLIIITKNKYAIYPTFITTNGLKDNAFALALALDIQNSLTLEDLF